MTVAGHLTKVFAKSSNTTPTDPDDLVDGIDKASLQRMVNLLETTDFKDTSGARTRVPGLSDCAISISGDAEMADAPQELLRTSFGSSIVYITIHTNPSGSSGAKGWQVPCYVEKESNDSAVDGKATVSYDLKPTGAVTRV